MRPWKRLSWWAVLLTVTATTTAWSLLSSVSTLPRCHRRRRCHSRIIRTHASADSDSSSSPWAPAEWRLDLNLGREPGTYMSDDWGASGARLALSCQVLVESESYDNDAPDDDFFGPSCSVPDRISVLEDPVLVTTKDGAQTIRLADEGAWKRSTRRTGRRGDASSLRLWIQLNHDKVVARNDVSIDAHERLYLTTRTWRTDELQPGLRRMEPLVAALDDAQARLDAQLAHDSGDRRLDGTNPVETAQATMDMAVLVKARDDRLWTVKEGERTLPPIKNGSLSKPGDWPGHTEQLVVAKGKVAVKRRKSQLLGGDEYHIVGTWTATPLEGVSEYYVEDEDEEDRTQDQAK